MRNTTKLLSILALGSALSGCSMAGSGDFFADQYAHTQQSQMSHYWGDAQSPCQPAPAGCESAYATGAAQTYGAAPHYAQAVTPSQHAYGQAVPQHQIHQGQAHQLPQSYAGYQGQPAYPQSGYAPAGYAPAYVGARGGSSRGLRQSYTYGTLGATLYDVDSDLYGLQARAGWQSKSLFGAEVEGSFGLTDDDGAVVIFNGVPLAAETEVDTQLAGFGVVRYPVSNKFNVLGRLGYHNTEFNGRVTDGVNTSDVEFSTDGVAYGAGVEYALTPLMGLRADFTRYDLDGENTNAVSLAVTRKF